MGAGEPPLLPNYEFLAAAPENRTVVKAFYECNYLQGNEGNMDPVHLSFLHQYLSEAQVARLRVVKEVNATDNTLLAKDVAPTIEVEVTNLPEFKAALGDPRRLEEKIQELASRVPGLAGKIENAVSKEFEVLKTAYGQLKK